MDKISSISKLPNYQAVYVLYGGKTGKRFVAYVGIADRLRRRIEQHLITRDSSVATGTSATGLNPDYVTELRWWKHSKFSDRNQLIASELVAFDVFQPTLRSRGNTPQKAKSYYEKEDFKTEMMKIFEGNPTGRLVIPTLQDALDRIEKLENRIIALENKYKE